MKVKNLQPSPYNPRKITDEKLRMLGKSMKEFGDLSGIVFNVRTKHLIGGHQRIKHLDPAWPIEKSPTTDKTGTVALGTIETPFGLWSYREVDWPEKKEIAANIAANQHGGDFDIPKLKDLIVEIDDGETDTDHTGFSQKDLAGIFSLESEPLEYEEKEIRYFKMTHVLLSFPPEKLMETKDHLEAIIATDGVEYEQSAN